MPKMDTGKCAKPKLAGNQTGTCMAGLAFAIGRLALLLANYCIYCNYDNGAEMFMFVVVLSISGKLTKSGSN